MSRQRAFCFRASVIALASVFSGAPFANPANPSVVAGQAVFQQSGKTLTVTNSPGAIINWQSFNIDRGELTRFIQQNASSQVLNRVTGGDPSKILGSLQSNGRVILINPNGVAFGAGAQVDVAGLLVSTLQIKDADFLAGKLRFNDTPGAGSIKNEGSIRTASGGQVILIAPQVENSGLIHAPEGQILLAAGRSVTIADPERPAIQVEITNSEQTAVNLGTLIGKEISFYGGLVKNSGNIQATTAVVGENGRIRLRAMHGVENTGTLQASGPQGGDILLQAEQGMARVQGVIEARGLASIEIAKATPSAPQLGKGGRIEILAPEIDVNATIDASGTAGGGAVFIGGDYQGGSSAVPVAWQDNAALKRASLALEEPFAASPSLREASSFSPGAPDNGQQAWLSGSAQPGLPARPLPTARTLRFGTATRVRADAIEEGDGGVIVAWADGVTRAQGGFSARGGAIGGDGGLVEISGKGLLDFNAAVDTSAPKGQRGMLLLDPTNITIGDTANINGDGTTGDDITGAGDLALDSDYGTVDSYITASKISMLLDATDVVLSATNDINVNASIYSVAETHLTLNAGRDINSNANITTSNLSLNAGRNINTNADITAGNISLNPGLADNSGKVIVGAGVTLNSTYLWVGGTGSLEMHGATIDVEQFSLNTLALAAGDNTFVNPTGEGSYSLESLYVSGGNMVDGFNVTTQNLYWTAGDISGQGTLKITQWGEISSTAPKTLSKNMLLEPHAELIQSGTGNSFIVDSTVTNLGTYRIGDDSGISGAGQLVNYGSIVKTGGTGESIVAIGLDNTTNDGAGSLGAETGALVFSGTSNLNGASLAGYVRFAGELFLSGNIDGHLDIKEGISHYVGSAYVESMKISGGELALDANLSVNDFSLTGGRLSGAYDLTVSGSFDWTGGEMVGAGRTIIQPSATALVSSSDTKLLGRILENRGELRFDGASNFDIVSGGLLDNRNILLLAGGSSIQSSDGFGTIENNFSVSGAGAQTNEIGARFVNNARLGDENYGTGIIRLTGPIELGDNSHVGSSVRLAGPTTIGGTLSTDSRLTLATGSTLTFNSDQTISDLTLEGGILDGTGQLTVVYQFSWTSGDMRGSGETILLNSASGQISGPGLKNLTRTLTNYGALTQSGTGAGAASSFRINDSGHLRNFTTYEILDDSGISFSGTPGLVTNDFNNNHFAKTGGSGVSEILVPANLGGSIYADTGAIRFSNSTTVTDPVMLDGRIEFAGDVSLLNSVSGGGVMALVPGGRLVGWGPDVSIASLEIAGGAIAEGANYLVENSFIWTSGNVSGNGQLVLGPSANSEISSSAPKSLTRVLRNDGLLQQIDTGDSFKVSSGGVLENRGTYEISGTSDIGFDGSIGQFNNFGIVTVPNPASTSTISISYTAFDGGSFDVASGNTLKFMNSVELSPTSVNTGPVEFAGYVRATGRDNFKDADITLWSNAIAEFSNNDYLVRSVNLRGGEINTNASVEITNGITLSSGTLSGYGTISMTGGTGAISSTINLAGSTNFRVAGGSFAIEPGSGFDGLGNIFWSGGTFTGTGHLALLNDAVLYIDSGAKTLNGPTLDVTYFSLDQAGATSLESGAINVVGETWITNGSTLSVTGGSFSSAGDIHIDSGTMDIAGGVFAPSGSIYVSPTGEFRKSSSGTTSISVPFYNSGLTSVTAGDLHLVGGGGHDGRFEVVSGASIRFSAGDVDHRFYGGATLAGGGSYLSTGGVLVENLTIAADANINLNLLTLGGSGVLHNTGHLSGSGVTFAGELVNDGFASLDSSTLGGLTNQGSLNISGSLTVQGVEAYLDGGTIYLDSGASLVKDGGTLNWSDGTFGGNGTLSYINGGNFAFSGAGDRVIDNPNLTFAFTDLNLPNGSLTLRNGGLTFNTAGGTTVIPAGTALNMYGGTITNNGPLNISGDFGLYGGQLAGAGAINMTGGTIDMPANSTVNWTATGPLSNTGTLNLGNRTITNAITNTGTINATGGLVFTQLFTNQGTFNLTGGTTTFSAGYLQTAGTTTFNGGNAAGTMTLNGGSLGGSGTLTGNLINNGGALNVGFSPGTLNIAGNLVLGPSSVINIELGGTTPGSGFDLINVSGTATLDGTLNVLAYGGYTPGAGTNYSFMNFASSSGAFSSSNIPGGWSMTMSSLATYLDLLAAGALPPAVSPALPAIVEIANDVIQGQTMTSFNRGDAPEGDLGVVQSLFQSTQFAQNEEDFLSLRQCQ